MRLAVPLDKEVGNNILKQSLGSPAFGVACGLQTVLAVIHLAFLLGLSFTQGIFEYFDIPFDTSPFGCIYYALFVICLGLYALTPFLLAVGQWRVYVSAKFSTQTTLKGLSLLRAGVIVQIIELYALLAFSVFLILSPYYLTSDNVLLFLWSLVFVVVVFIFLIPWFCGVVLLRCYHPLQKSLAKAKEETFTDQMTTPLKREMMLVVGILLTSLATPLSLMYAGEQDPWLVLLFAGVGCSGIILILMFVVLTKLQNQLQQAACAKVVANYGVYGGQVVPYGMAPFVPQPYGMVPPMAPPYGVVPPVPQPYGTVPPPYGTQPQPQPMVCPGCGNPISAGQSFCANCGTTLSQNQ